MTRVRAYTVADAGRSLGLTSAGVHKGTECEPVRAFTTNKATRVADNEVERVQANPRHLGGHLHEESPAGGTSRWPNRSPQMGPI